MTEGGTGRARHGFDLSAGASAGRAAAADLDGPAPAGRPMRRRRRYGLGIVLSCGLSGGLAISPALADPASAVNRATTIPPVAPSDAASPPPSAVPLPGAPPGPLSTPAPTGRPAGSSGGGTSTATRTPAAAPPVGPQRAQTVTGHKPAATTETPAPAAPATPNPAAPAPAAASGLPLPLDPTFSLATVGPLPVRVPDFFIESFRIPAFLLPIYQAAGVEYGVPWQALAAINEIETDYGRNLTTSSAGAEGWMQFLPAAWAKYGVDGNNDGVKDPYNPVDAIFAAARFLHDAGAAQSLPNALLAYGNAQWYVDSVMLRARLIGGLPADLVNSITGMTDGQFPVHAPSQYAAATAATNPPARARAQNAAPALSPGTTNPAISVYAAAGAPVVAVHDGVITAMGNSPSLGSFVLLRDAFGNVYAYSQLKKLANSFAVARAAPATAAAVPGNRRIAGDAVPRTPATAGHQSSQSPLTAPTAAPPSAAAASSPTLPLTAGRPGAVEVRPLTTGVRVPAGTRLGWIGASAAGEPAHLTFQIRPAGAGGVPIDPKPILDGWTLVEATRTRPTGSPNPFRAQNGRTLTIGQILLESTAPLQVQVLADPALDLPACGRDDVQAGRVDRRVLGALEVLAAAGLKPTVSTPSCASPPAAPASPAGPAGLGSADASGPGVDVTQVNGTPIAGHQGAGSITDRTIRWLLTLQGSFKPAAIDSLMTYPSTDNTSALPGYADRIHIAYPAPAPVPASPAAKVVGVLSPGQWRKLSRRLGQIANPSLPPGPGPASPGAPAGSLAGGTPLPSAGGLSAGPLVPSLDPALSLIAGAPPAHR